MHVRLSTKWLLDALTGWGGAAPSTRARLLEAFCSGIRSRSLISNSVAAVIVAAFIISETRDPVHVAWLISALAGGLLPRMYAARLRRTARFDESPERTALAFVGISAVYGLIWGVGPFLLLPDISGDAVGILLVIIVFGTIMGPYAAMPGILYARLATTGIPTLVAIALYTSPQLTLVSIVLGLWLALRTDIWRGYHRALRRQIELRETLEHRQAELQHANRAKEQANESLKILAETDPLTGAANRRQFMRRLEEIDGPAALVLLDVDYFKAVNDDFGHQIGDAVLVDLTGLVQNVLRKEDLLARLGGDEFAILLPGATRGDAWNVAERIRQGVAGHAIRRDTDAIRATVSLGIATTQDGPPRPDGTALLHAADAALYAAKRQGRNRIQIGGQQGTSVGA